MQYAQDHEGFVHRGIPFGPPPWYVDYIPYLGETDNGDYRPYKVYRCPSHANKQATITYVINGWDFATEDPHAQPDGMIEVVSPTPLANFSKPAETIYFADMEDGPEVPDVRSADFSLNAVRMDVFEPLQLPSSPNDAYGGNLGRRVPPDRHGQGHNAVYADGHAGFVSGNLTEEEYIKMWMNRR